ncbi:MAG: DUF1801 domain-containing protein [Steroidobacteraceae bacterium]
MTTYDAGTAPPTRLMRFPEAVRHEPAIDAWLASRPAELGEIARRWFDAMRDGGPDGRELLHDGHPTACIDDAAYGYVNVFRDHVNVGFFLGAHLADPAGLLEGEGRFMRHVKLRPGVAVDETALRALIDAARTHMRTLVQPA